MDECTCDCGQDRIVEYDVVCSSWSSEMGEKVNKKIKEGWQPYGSLTCKQNGDVYQAIVKYEDPTEALKRFGFDLGETCTDNESQDSCPICDGLSMFMSEMGIDSSSIEKARNEMHPKTSTGCTADEGPDDPRRGCETY